jgi:membrane-associated phospholipid phosphatase
VTAEAGHWWPAHQTLIGVLSYGGAALAGAARLYENRHWASDVVLGAGMGTLAGRLVVRRQHAHPRNWIDRTLLHLVVAPGAGGGGGAVVGIRGAW